MIHVPEVQRLTSARRRVRKAHPRRAVIAPRVWLIVALACLASLGTAVIATTSGAAVPSRPLTFPRTATIGERPVAMALDSATHTVYIANQESDSVSVLNADDCTTRTTSACTRDIASVTLGAGANPQGVAVDPATDTVYVADNGGAVSVINGATCNAQDRSGCTVPVARIADPGDPLAVAVNQATDTVYVTNDGPFLLGTGSTVSVIDGATCNGSQTGGCGQTPATIGVGQGPDAVAVDPAVTVFVGVTATFVNVSAVFVNAHDTRSFSAGVTANDVPTPLGNDVVDPAVASEMVTCRDPVNDVDPGENTGWATVGSSLNNP